VSGDRPRRLWVIDPSLARAEKQGVGEILNGWTGEHRLFLPALRPGDGPGRVTGYETDGVVLMGSMASVMDDLPWLDELGRWLEPIVDGTVRVPLLGICFGHQLIAHLAGARVGYLNEEREKRFGVETSVLEGGSLLPGRHEVRVVVSHREEVKECPATFRVVADRGSIAVDGLEHGRLPLFSFQFHPEAREEFAGHAGIRESLIDSRVREDNRRLLAAFRLRIHG
jgi:GMP synthase-like glutamine amidotransferase